MEPQILEPIGIIAFDGITKNSLHLHPDGKYLIYPMGHKITVRNIESGEQKFLNGHTNNVSALCISSCGEYIASGQNNHLGFKAMVIIWNYKDRTMRGSYEIHKVGIEDMCFTCNSDFLVSLGGRDDGNVIVWDVRNNSPICGLYASNEISGDAYNIVSTNIHAGYFVTGGDRTMKIWRINAERKKVHGIDVEVGKLKRIINCIVISEKDEIIYCGTSSGDIIKARLNLCDDLQCGESARPPVMIGCYSKITSNLKKMKVGEGDLYAGGVKNLLLLKDQKLIVGAGDGGVELIEIVDRKNPTAKTSKFPNTPQIFTHKRENVCSEVTSMVLYRNEFILVGTSWCEIYQIQLSNFHMCLLLTSHTGCIACIAFPWNYAETFATGGKNDIRLWKLETQREILRITVPNFTCSSLYFARDGQMLVSAWNDGTIRAFMPHNGELYFAIHNAHTKAVSTVVVTTDGIKLISGGCDGQVRIWEIKTHVQRLISVLKEHRSPITSLHISCNNEDLISSSTDGTCVIWDITRYVRKHVLIGNTMFMMTQFSPDGVQIITCGTDRKIAYWESLDGSLVREIEGSTVGSLNCIDISFNGRYFITGSNDCIMKIWEYESANVTHIGISHAAIITACKFSPDGKHIVTTSADGAIIIWKSSCEILNHSSVQTERVTSSKSTHSLHSNTLNKLSLRKSENGKEVAANRLSQFAKTSVVSCTDNQEQLIGSGKSNKSKKETNEERMSIYRCASLESAHSKLNGTNRSNDVKK